MQIAINISEESYKNIKEQVDKRDYPDMQIGRAIVDGVLIPEGHGRLIDEYTVMQMIDDAKVKYDNSKTFAENVIRFAPPVIEADKERKHDN